MKRPFLLVLLGQGEETTQWCMGNSKEGLSSTVDLGLSPMQLSRSLVRDWNGSQSFNHTMTCDKARSRSATLRLVCWGQSSLFLQVVPARHTTRGVTLGIQGPNQLTSLPS